MLFLVSTLIVAAVIGWGCAQVARELKAMREEVGRARSLHVLSTFAAALQAASADPRSILDWEPLARTARQLYAEEFAQLDGALGSTFPFSAERIQNAHARWTAEWLAWERTHDAEYKLKAAAAEEELTRSAGSTVARARLRSE